MTDSIPPGPNSFLGFARQDGGGGWVEGERCGLQPGAEEVFFHAPGVSKGTEWEVMKQ